jgi:hypothetical protein
MFGQKYRRGHDIVISDASLSTTIHASTHFATAADANSHRIKHIVFLILKQTTNNYKNGQKG